MKITTAFREGNIEESGWTSQYSFIPDWMLKLNNQFLTIKAGQLWLHNDRANPIRNNFYGVQYGSSVTTIFNEFNSDDKIFKTLVVESDQKWKAELLTNYTQGRIESNEFETKESRQFAFVRGNESQSMNQGNTIQGIGALYSLVTNTMKFNYMPELISVGDKMYQVDNEIQVEIGIITAINEDDITFQIDTFVNVPVVGLYSFAMKDRRIEGEAIRGHYLEVKLSNEDPIAGELFAVATNSVKSHV